MSVRRMRGEPGKREPKCKRCGHRPCPGCVDWCDTMMWNIYCPECEEVVSEQKDEKDGDEIQCPHCQHKWPLQLVEKGRAMDDIGVDPCCDGECDWDLPMAEVEAWCDQYKRK